MITLDDAVEAQKQRVAKQEAFIIAKFVELKAKLDPVAAAAKTHRDEISEFTPKAKQTISKARLAGWGTDPIVSEQILQLTGQMNNAGFLQIFLKEYAEESPNNLKLENGEFDVNAPMRKYCYYTSAFLHGNGCRKAMENSVKQIESRVSYLEESKKWSEGKAPARASGDVVTLIAPARKAPELTVLTTNQDAD